MTNLCGQMSQFRYSILCTGAQDFLPDFEPGASCVSIASIYPRYQPIASAVQKARKWIAEARVCVRLWHSWL